MILPSGVIWTMSLMIALMLKVMAYFLLIFIIAKIVGYALIVFLRPIAQIIQQK
jgi:hypothetical protein